jgi:hypothetical protein
MEILPANQFGFNRITVDAPQDYDASQEVQHVD